MNRPLEVDWLRQQPEPEILPNPPLLTSRLLHWRGIEVQQHGQPAWDSPEVCFKQHVISIHDFAEPARSVSTSLPRDTKRFRSVTLIS